MVLDPIIKSIPYPRLYNIIYKYKTWLSRAFIFELILCNFFLSQLFTIRIKYPSAEMCQVCVVAIT